MATVPAEQVINELEKLRKLSNEEIIKIFVQQIMSRFPFKAIMYALSMIDKERKLNMKIIGSSIKVEYDENGETKICYIEES